MCVCVGGVGEVEGLGGPIRVHPHLSYSWLFPVLSAHFGRNRRVLCVMLFPVGYLLPACHFLWP